MFRFARLSAAALLLLISANVALSDTCRSELEGRPATILVANKAGGGYDTYARAIAPVLADLSGLRVRVVNNAAGGGAVARQLMLAAGDDSLTMLIENAVDMNVQLVDDSSQQSLLELVDVLGIVHTEPGAWVLGADIDIYDTGITNLVAAQGTVDDGLIPIVLAGMGLGLSLIHI